MAFLKSLTLDNLCKLQMEIGWLGTDRMSLIEETESEVERRKGLVGGNQSPCSPRIDRF